MASIGRVAKKPNGNLEGMIVTATVRFPIVAVPVANPTEKSPIYRVYTTETGYELGGIWQNQNSRSEGTHLSMSVHAPELPRRLNARLGREAGQDDPDVMALIWIE